MDGGTGTMTSPRRVLFLQGPPTGFWRELAAAFEEAGHETRRVNLSTADWLIWRRPGAHAFRGGFSRWRDWIAAYLAREGITDVLYFADRLPYHVVAAEEAGRLGIPCHAVEFGYLRPDWITLERTGMGAYSHFPADPDAIRAIAARLDEKPSLAALYAHSFFGEAWREVAFNVVNALFAWPWPAFRMDKRYHPLTDYISWLPRLFGETRRSAHADRVAADCVSGAWPYHLVALQIESDYQLRDNSPYGSLREAIAEIMASFARSAPAENRLIFKLHPLDNGFENWARVVAEAARAQGVEARVITIDGGPLDQLIRHSRGVISVNSTVGMHAIRARRPVLALGAAIYDMPGLAHQGPASTFWTDPQPVDPRLVSDFLKVLAATIQVKGSFYHPDGRALAKAEVVRRVAGGRVNQPDAFLPTPPRLPIRRRAWD